MRGAMGTLCETGHTLLVGRGESDGDCCLLARPPQHRGCADRDEPTLCRSGDEQGRGLSSGTSYCTTKAALSLAHQARCAEKGRHPATRAPCLTASLSDADTPTKSALTTGARASYPSRRIGLEPSCNVTAADSEGVRAHLGVSCSAARWGAPLRWQTGKIARGTLPVRAQCKMFQGPCRHRCRRRCGRGRRHS